MAFLDMVQVGDVCFSSIGIGGEKYNQFIENFPALEVWMRPSTFLKVATPLEQPRSSLVWIKNWIRKEGSIAPPSLRIWMPNREEGIPAIVQHDGRHRATLLRDMLNDQEIPVTLLFDNLMVSKERALDLVNEKLLSQNRQTVLHNQNFKQLEVSTADYSWK